MTVQLRAGDILLYRPSPFKLKHFWTWPFGQLISIKTWHRISHVEVYDGARQSLASRDGQGVGRYPLRLTELTYVLRPTAPLDLVAGRVYFASMQGTPYGWLDLAQFSGINVNAKGIVCSPFATNYLRACGWNIFPTDPAERVAPFQFLDLVGPECRLEYGPLTETPDVDEDA